MLKRISKRIGCVELILVYILLIRLGRRLRDPENKAEVDVLENLKEGKVC